jgi:signal transduction histidine kinase/streptogramin lyase/ActR/RegA family two-component response regulator
MRLTVRSLLGLLVLAFASFASAAPETPQFRVVGVADGLPSSEIAALALDRDGYLWIGTRDGLARYDGVGYRIYRHVPGDASSLPGNSVQALHVDAKNRLWIGVESQGIAMLGPERGGFTRIAQDNRPILHSNDVWSIAGTPDGAVWFGTYAGGLYRLDAAGRMTRFLPRAGDPRSLPSADVSALATLADGSLWIGTFGGGVVRWTGRDFEPLADGALRTATIFGLAGDPDGSLWIGMGNGVARRFADGRMDDAAWLAKLHGRRVQAIVTDLEGMRWFATREGLVTERGGRLRELGDYPLALGPMTAGLEDRDGGLWFGTNGAGLRRLPPNWRNFSVFGKDEGIGRVAALPVVGHAPARDGRVWLLGGSVVQRLDPLAGSIATEVDIADQLPATRLWSLHEREDGALWLGHSRGLSLYQPARKAWRHWGTGDADDPALPGAVQSLVESHGLLWLMSYGGGVQARDADGALVHNLPSGERGVDTPDQDQMSLGPDGRVWLAGPKGLRRWNPEEERFDAIPGAPDAHVYGFTLVPPDALWLHRMGQLEAYRWNGAALARFRSVGVKDGLPAAESGGLFADRGGALWLTTARGLVRYDPLGARLRVFGVRDGLPSQEFLMYPPLMLPQGLGLASTRAGVVLFDPARIRSGWTAPRLVLESVRFRRGDAAMHSPPGLRALTLSPEDRDLRVGARLLSFADPASHRYQFRLRGYERDWVDVGASGEREFSQLPPGDYRLEAKAGNADGLWSAPLSFEVRVLAPWWRRPVAAAAWGVLALALLVVIGRAYRARVRERAALQLREQQRRLSDQGSEAKTRFLATLGHEIRTPMTGVLGMAELLQRGPLAPRQRMQVEAIHRAGEHLLRLVNDALDLARIEAGKLVLDDTAFDLHLLVEDSAALLRPLAEAKSLEFALHRAPGTPRAVRGDAGRVRQILFNLGSNAIKFTDHGEVALRVAGTPHGLLLEIADTGHGMSETQQARLFQRFEQLDAGGELRRQGSGLGLAICRELAQAMGGRIDVQSQPGRGTTFRVLLPLPVVEGIALAPAPRRRRVRAANGLDILVVEDDPTIADVVTGLLEALGHRTEHAANGLAALTALAQSRFDLAFLDLDLPGLDGFNLARVIRGQGHGTALVALTARADAQAEPLALAAGMHGFLRKPVTSAMLQDAIDRTMVALRGSPVVEQAQL